MQATRAKILPSQPYPGLRSFEATESLLFHGRDRHTEELLRRLAQNRFLAVVGGSGSGKSSLVRAGLLPALYRGYLVGATSKWRVAVMRPGSAPLDEMAKALAKQGVLKDADRDLIRESSYGLVKAVRSAGVADGESLLLVVDQFEELFRFRRESAAQDGGTEAALFVSQLLRAADEYGAPIYVVLTMRSDFLGDCAQFPNLPEALNKGQYLIPRMTREQRRQAITDALDLFDASMSDPLVQRLLNDAGEDPDQLPVLQHALRQTYVKWEKRGRKGDIDLNHYIDAGTMERALHNHAQDAYDDIDEDLQWLAERIFRCITVLENGRAIRRPAKLRKVLEVIGVAGDPLYEPEAIRIVRKFSNRENSFLVVGDGQDPDAQPHPDDVVDISHESLIRKWDTLRDWVKKEAKVAEIYRYLRRDAGLYPQDAALWGQPDLGRALDCKKDVSWNEDWAAQYSDTPGVPFAKVQEFLALCVAEERRKQLRERLFRIVMVASFLLAVALVVVGIKLFFTERANRAFEEQNRTLSEGTAHLQEEVDKRQKTIDALKAESASGNVQARAQLEQLTMKQEIDRQSLADREKLIQANKDQVSKVSGDYAQALQRITDLQTQLTQAWKERDQAKSELQNLSDKSARQQRPIVFTRPDTTDEPAQPIKQMAQGPQQGAKPTQTQAQSQQRAEVIPERSRPGAGSDVNRTLRPPLVNSRDGLTYVWIYPGALQMGCRSDDASCADDEKPIHQIKITRGFYLGQTEVTQRAFYRVMRSWPSFFKGDHLPVEQVTWDEARKYCESQGMRLPTEAEWEYAANAGGLSLKATPIEDIAWYYKNANRTNEVKQKKPNDWGLYDMLGNVWEWVGDYYSESYYKQSPVVDPPGPLSRMVNRVGRGASWNNRAKDLRLTVRGYLSPTQRYNTVGFRCAGESVPAK
jgi:formylglycine-generating enzyme required for sulfatase activity